MNAQDSVSNSVQLRNLSSIRKYKERTDESFVFLIIFLNIDEKTELLSNPIKVIVTS